MDWVRGIQNVVYFIEDNITEDLDYDIIAKQAYVSSFHFQRAFSILCGFTLGEYIRNRRLTLAGLELSLGNARVIDTAVKYGYDSPDSFTKAFIRFHGISPSSAKKEGAKLKSIAPLKIKLHLEGGNEARMWAVFPCIGALPTALQEVNTKIWTEWIPNCREYELDGNFNIEMYTDGDTGSADYQSEIWIPVRKK